MAREAAPLKTAKEPGEKHRSEPILILGERKNFKHMEQKKNWPKDYNDEEIRDGIEIGALKESGFSGAKEAGLAELLIRNKKSAEKSDEKIFKLSTAILVVSILGLVASIIF